MRTLSDTVCIGVVYDGIRLHLSGIDIRALISKSLPVEISVEIRGDPNVQNTAFCLGATGAHAAVYPEIFNLFNYPTHACHNSRGRKAFGEQQ